MLRYSINCNKDRITDVVLNTPVISLVDGNALTFSAVSCSIILKNDLLSFYRKDGSEIEYYEERVVNSAEHKEELSGYTVSVSPFDNINVSIVSAYTETIDGVDYVFFKFDKEHYFNSNRDNTVIKKNVNYPEDEEDLCPNDIFIKNNYFIYQRTGNGDVLLNKQCFVFFEDFYGKYKKDGLVPCTLGGVDMKQTVMFKMDEDLQQIYDNFVNVKCWIKDCRFFDYRQIVIPSQDSPYNDEYYKYWHLYLKPGTSIRIRKGDPKLSIELSSEFSPYLLAEDGISQYLAEDADKKIAPTLDYEKQQFIPIVSASSSYDVSKISFYIHLRERDENWDVLPNGGWRYPHADYGDEIIGYDGFDNEDIYYQRKCVSETFLRVSFYDSTDRGKQKLLYSAKVYLDENRLWSEYVKNEQVFKGVNMPENYLRFMFICTNKYDYNNKTEGFYLHLFPGNLNELGEEGGVVYAKFELCHAKYGKTIPLTMPVYPNGVVSGSTFEVYGKTFDERNYLDITSDGKKYTDMSALNNDMYVEVRLKYENNRFVWHFEGATEKEDAENLKLHLYEPKLF